MPNKSSEITTIADLDTKKQTFLFTDSQDVKGILEAIGCDEDYGGIFIYDGIAYGFEGNVPYLNKRLYRIGEYRES